MQLLFDTSQLLAINCPAFICSPCQLVYVVSNVSQLLGYLDCTRLVDFWRFHSIAHCPLFRKSWHAHMKGFRYLLNPFKFAVVHTKFNQIGRASCRERVEYTVVYVVVEEK